VLSLCDKRSDPSGKKVEGLKRGLEEGACNVIYI